jgi:hypothetical protein
MLAESERAQAMDTEALHTYLSELDKTMRSCFAHSARVCLMTVFNSPIHNLGPRNQPEQYNRDDGFDPEAAE